MSEASYLVQNFVTLEVSELLSKVKELKSENYRLGQICGTPADGKIEIMYSFDKDLAGLNLKLTVENETSVPSITETYWPAFIYENEIHDLFGVTFTDSKLDYNGNFFRLAKPTPWKPAAPGGGE